MLESHGAAASPPQPKEKKNFKKKEDRPFDMSKYPQRHIVLRIAYHGHRFDGLSKQDHTTNTIEGFVVEALKRVRLIAPEGPEKFSRCGRTDKGVSALGNAFSLMVRASTDDSKPLDYCDMLNRALPPTIRIVGWSFVPDTFDARFSCKYRVYRYYFLHRGLSLDKMNEAASHLVGTHNFRNFCMLDVVNVDNFVRDISSVKIVPSSEAPDLFSYCEIIGNAFLYHQIRCTMTVLLLVGRGFEEPSVVKALLERGDAKPIYSLADDSPLILWNCGFDPAEVAWNFSREAREFAMMELQDITTALMIRAVAAADMKSQISQWYDEKDQHDDDDDDDDGGDTKKNGEERRTCLSSSAVSENFCKWDATGSDWTSEHLQPLLKKREYDVFMMKKWDRTKAGVYTKLLDREIEATYDERVKCLSGSKKARHETNQAKKRPRE